MPSFFSNVGHALGGVIKAGARAGIGLVPGGGTALSVYDAYNTSRGRVGAFSPPGMSSSGGGVIKGGGGGPPVLPAIGMQPGTSMIQRQSTPEMGGGAGQVFQTPDGQWHQKGWRGARGHMTKGSRRNPPHWTNRRRPRMNPMNVHAARRSVRRLVAGEKLFRKIFRIMHHHKAAVTPKRIGRK